MNNFRRDDRSRDSRDGRPPLHDAVCADCGKDCKVPFRPSGSKPVFCSECFEQKEGGRGGRDGRAPRRDSFRPRFGGRDGRDNRPPRRDGGGGGDFSQLTRSIDTLNSKLDRIIVLLGSSAADAKTKKKKKSNKMEGVAEMVASLKKSDVSLEQAEVKKASKPKVKSKSKVKAEKEEKPKKSKKPKKTSSKSK